MLFFTDEIIEFCNCRKSNNDVQQRIRETSPSYSCSWLGQSWRPDTIALVDRRRERRWTKWAWQQLSCHSVHNVPGSQSRSFGARYTVGGVQVSCLGLRRFLISKSSAMNDSTLTSTFKNDESIKKQKKNEQNQLKTKTNVL